MRSGQSSLRKERWENGIRLKHCGRCKKYLPESEFHKAAPRYDGLASYCKPCNRAQQAGHRKTKEWREMRRKYRNSKNGSRAYHRYYKKAKGKKLVQLQVSAAVKRGDLVKPKRCEECGEQRQLHGHHDDYAKPLAVRWLCRFCHMQWHAENGEGANVPLSTGGGS